MKNERSIKNLVGKTEPKHMTRRCQIETENTVKNYLFAVQFHNEKKEKEKESVEQTTYANSPLKAPTQKLNKGGVFVSGNVLRNQKKCVLWLNENK